MSWQSSLAELRVPTADDVPALAELSTRRFGGMIGSEISDRLASPMVNAQENWRVLPGPNGPLAGGVFLWHPEPGAERVFVHVIAYPEDGETYGRLLDWGEGRARQLTQGVAGRVHSSSGGDNELLAEILRKRGYQLVRHFFTMEIDLADEPPPSDWPKGIEVRTFRPGEERAVFDVDMEAFQDHWDFFPVPFEEWRDHFVGSSRFDPELWFLACEGGEIAGIALGSWESRPGIGRVSVLAVRRPWRRRGLGRALLLHAFRQLRRRGRERVDLQVDADNLTGAVRLYEEAGMRVAHREDSYRRDL
jgi:mycothiol synthase